MDTSTVSGLEVRTCAREEVGLSQLACGDGMTVRDAAAFAGVGMGAAKRWSAGDLPGSCTGRPVFRQVDLSRMCIKI